MTGIYKITSPINESYIGQSRNIVARMNGHKNKALIKHRLLRASFDKFGYAAHSFDILHDLPNDVEQEVLDRYEILYIDQYKECGLKLLNLTSGGRVGFKLSEQTISLIKGKNGKWMTGRKLSPETIAKRSAKITGQKRSEETKKKLSDSKLGSKNPCFGKPAWNKGMPGSTRKKK